MITIDFWDTLVIAERGGNIRREVRHDALQEVASGHVENLSVADIEAASQEASDEFHRVWFNHRRTPTADELITKVLDILDVPATKQEHDYLTRVFEESLLDGPPELVPSAKKAVEKLAESHKIGLISDTMYSPGRVLKQFLNEHELLHFFDDFIFSDEVGFSKPDPRAFTQILKSTNCKAAKSYHIGDRLNTDIKGAKDVGMKAILFTGVSEKKKSREEDGVPDHTCESWDEIIELLA